MGCVVGMSVYIHLTTGAFPSICFLIFLVVCVNSRRVGLYKVKDMFSQSGMDTTHHFTLLLTFKQVIIHDDDDAVTKLTIMG